MLDWNGLLARKYDILQQQADTARLGMQASANLDTVKAGLLPAESKAQIGLVGAQTGLAGATAKRTAEETKYVGPLANASIGESRGRGRLLGAQATGEEQLNKLTPTLFKFRGLGNSLGSIDQMVRTALRAGMGPFASDDE